MSRVFSASWVLLAASCGRGPGLIVAVSEKAPGLASTASFQGCPNPKALSSIQTEQHSLQALQRKWDLALLPVSAQLRLPVGAFLALFLLTERLLELPCSGHASLCRWLRVRQPGTSRPWQPRPSNGACEAAEGLPRCAGCPSVGRH